MANYKDPRDEKMTDGRSLADLMRRGPGGLRGVVVAKATRGGTPENFNPHDITNVCVNVVNPDGSNSYSLPLSKISGETMNRAQAVAKQRIPGEDIESIRERSAVVFEELARLSAGVKPVNGKPVPPIVPAAPTEEQLVQELESAIAPLAVPPIEQIDRNYSPMAAFGLKKPAITSASSPSISTGSRVVAPQKLVYFEKEGLGTVPAFYHDVLVQITREDPDNYEYTGFMVLVYDLRFEQNLARWFPPANDPYQRPWAAQIKDDGRLYLVQTTGFQYVYDNREYCVLSVERAVMAAGEEG